MKRIALAITFAISLIGALLVGFANPASAYVRQIYRENVCSQYFCYHVAVDNHSNDVNVLSVHKYRWDWQEYYGVEIAAQTYSFVCFNVQHPYSLDPNAHIVAVATDQVSGGSCDLPPFPDVCVTKQKIWVHFQGAGFWGDGQDGSIYHDGCPFTTFTGDAQWGAHAPLTNGSNFHYWTLT